MNTPRSKVVVELRPRLGRSDPETLAALESKREEARAWMRQRGIPDLNEPVEVTPLGVYTGRVNSTMEGV